MHQIVKARPLPDYKMWLRFADGVEGVIDLSDLVGRGIFAAWQDPKYFEAVFVDPESHTIAWLGGIDLCPDSLYADVCGIDILRKSSNA